MYTHGSMDLVIAIFTLEVKVLALGTIADKYILNKVPQDELTKIYKDAWREIQSKYPDLKIDAPPQFR